MKGNKESSEIEGEEKKKRERVTGCCSVESPEMVVIGAGGGGGSYGTDVQCDGFHSFSVYSLLQDQN